MRPKFRRMSINHATELPGNLLFFDTETYSRKSESDSKVQVLSFRMCCAVAVRLGNGKVHSRIPFQTDSIADFWAFVRSRQQAKKPLWAFAHNLHFDLTQLDFWNALDAGEYRLRTEPGTQEGESAGRHKGFRGSLCTEGRPAFAVVLGTHGVVKFVGSENYLPMKLEKIGEQFDRPKMAMPAFKAPDSEWFRYCMNDVEIVESAILQLMNKWRQDDCGVWQLTAPQLALTSFRHALPAVASKPQSGELFLDDKDDWAAMERLAYFGGQTSCFYVGKVDPPHVAGSKPKQPAGTLTDPVPQGPLYLVDVNSLYAHCMRLYKFPNRRHKLLKSPSVAELRQRLHGFGAVASVRIDSPREPFICRQGKEQWHATGQFATVLCGPELQRAIDLGVVRHVWRAQLYSLDNLFERWVDRWTRRKLQAQEDGDRIDEVYTKLILTSLSGKFAQQAVGWNLTPKVPRPHRWGRFHYLPADGGPALECRAIAGESFTRSPAGEPWFSFPAISAFITSYARAWMYWLRSQLPAWSCLYQATDALIVTQAGLQAIDDLGLLHPTAIGSLKMVRMGDCGEIIGHNHYRIGEHWTRAGAWGAARRLKSGKWVYQVWQSADQVIEEGHHPEIKITEIELTRFSQWSKGSKSPSGWITPPALSDFEERF